MVRACGSLLVLAFPFLEGPPSSSRTPKGRVSSLSQRAPVFFSDPEGEGEFPFPEGPPRLLFFFSSSSLRGCGGLVSYCFLSLIFNLHLIDIIVLN
jgi:hypothetical protein